MAGIYKLLITILFASAKALDVDIISLSSSSNPVYGNISVAVVKGDDSSFTVNANCTIGTKFQSGIIQLALYNGEVNADRRKLIVKTNVNLCKAGETKFGNFLAKMFVEKVQKYTNFELKCPILKGDFHVRDFTASLDGLPVYLMRDNLKFNLEIKILGQLPKVKTAIELFTFKVFAELKKNKKETSR